MATVSQVQSRASFLPILARGTGSLQPAHIYPTCLQPVSIPVPRRHLALSPPYRPPPSNLQLRSPHPPLWPQATHLEGVQSAFGE